MHRGRFMWRLDGSRANPDGNHDELSSLGQTRRKLDVLARVRFGVGWRVRTRQCSRGIRAIELLIDPRTRPGAQHFVALRSAIEAKAGNQKMMRMLAQLLGYALGRRLYIAYMQSRISRKDIHALFRDPLNRPLRPLECYRELHLL